MKLAARWNDFWFAPADPADLAGARIAFCLGTLVFCDALVDRAWAFAPSAFWRPISFFVLLPGPPGPAALAALGAAWRVALMCAAVGFGTRLATAAAFALSAYLFGLRYCYGFLHTGDAITVVASLILACSDCGVAYSADQRIFRRRVPRTVPAWPLKLAWAAWSILFLSAAVAKLRAGGLGWVFSDNLARNILKNRLWFFGRSGEGLRAVAGPWLTQFPLLCRAGAGFTVLLELAAPLVLFSRRARATIVPSLFLFHALAWIFLLVDFRQAIPVYAFFVPWSRVLRAGGSA
jgi:hypothetical protein